MSAGTSRGAGEVTPVTTEGFLTATDGATIQYFTHGDPAAPALTISPAFTGSAKLYAERFGAALPDYYVMAVQLRGHGQGGGCQYEGLTFCTREQSPVAGSYPLHHARTSAQACSWPI